MSKHTAGDWYYHRMRIPKDATDRRCGFVVNGPDGPDPLPVRVCDLRVPAGAGGFAEGEANARLIASSPKLLEAIDKALMYFGNVNTAEWGEVLVALVEARAASSDEQTAAEIMVTMNGVASYDPTFLLAENIRLMNTLHELNIQMQRPKSKQACREILADTLFPAE